MKWEKKWEMKREKKQRQKHRKKSFFKIWMAVFLPLMAVTVLAGILVMGLILASLSVIEKQRSIQIAMELADLAGTEIANAAAGERVTEKCREYFNLRRYHMVAAVYDENGKQILCSDVSRYEESGILTNEMYADMLRVIETEGVNGETAYRTQRIDPFGRNYYYDETMMAAGGALYTLRYASVNAPYLEGKKDYDGMACSVLLFMAVFSLLPAGYYHKTYRERIRIEEYYRNTTNALAHELKTPLMAISGYAENLRENVHTEKKDHYADAILTNVSHMDRVIVNMLDLAGNGET